MAKPNNDVPVENPATFPMPIEAQEDESESRRRMDPELRVMAAMIRLIDDLDLEARARVVDYVSRRYDTRVSLGQAAIR